MASVFSPSLQTKIDQLKSLRKPISLGSVHFASPLLLAPMSGICTPPFRLLMEQLGAGGTVSELISCHGINHGNDKTLKMLEILPEEENVGLQLFGEGPEAMALAAKRAQDINPVRPKFIDINMGCPVRKVVTKGSGSALLQDPSKLGVFFSTIKKAIDVPLTIKIRIGWDENSINGLEVIHIAKNEGIEFVAVHGRTRAQQYRGQANWEYLEEIAQAAPLPIIGNGDLHTPQLVWDRMHTTKCPALMLARGPLRYPFLFLESLQDPKQPGIEFTPGDHLEIIQLFLRYLQASTDRERIVLTQLKKHVVWFTAGFKSAAQFRNQVFQAPDADTVIQLCQDYLGGLEQQGLGGKQINQQESFMAGGHG